MFLVLDRDEARVEDPCWFELRDFRTKHPAPLEIPRWRLMPTDQWLVTGPLLNLTTVVRLFDSAASEIWGTGWPARTAPRIRTVSLRHEDRSLRGWLRRWRRRRRRPAAVGHRVDRWLTDLAPAEDLERRVLEQIAEAFVVRDDIVVFDRVVRLLRPEIRFRVSADMRQLARNGTAIVALERHALDGWTAVERRAVIRRGVLERVIPDGMP